MGVGSSKAHLFRNLLLRIVHETIPNYDMSCNKYCRAQNRNHYDMSNIPQAFLIMRGQVPLFSTAMTNLWLQAHSCTH
jgi:hypothetical protein